MKDDTEKYGMKEFFLSILGLCRRLSAVIARQTIEDNGEILATVVHAHLVWYTVEPCLTDTPVNNAHL